MRYIAVFIAIVVLLSCAKHAGGPADPGSPPIGSETPQPNPDDPNLPAPTPGETPAPTPDEGESPKPTPVPVKPQPYKGDSAFRACFDLFIKEAAGFGLKFDTRNLTIKFGDLSYRGPGVIGLCQRGCSTCPKVTINPTWWNKRGDISKCLLIRHELGHCLLYRPHDTSVDALRNPLSIMYPLILSPSLFSRDQEGYLTELFTESLNDEFLPEEFVCSGGEE